MTPDTRRIRKPYSIDWTGLKAEYLSGIENLSALRRRHGIAITHFHKHTRGWFTEKAQIQQKAISNVEARLIDRYEEFVEETRNILSLMNKHILYSLKDHIIVGADGQIESGTPAPPDALQNIAKTLAENLKSVRLIEGKSTENRALAVQGDLNSALVAILDYMTQAGPNASTKTI